MSYEELYNIWRKEKESDDLQSISKSYFLKISQLIKAIIEEGRMLDRNSEKSAILIKEKENVVMMAKDLVRIRFCKMLRYIEHDEPILINRLTHEEETIYSGFRVTNKNFNKMLKQILIGQKPQIKNIGGVEPKRILVRFLQAIPSIVGSDMKIYGPFMVEDITTLPSENAQILIKNGLATEVEVL
jgi:DNA replication initiation complex subunit (GINS family)